MAIDQAHQQANAVIKGGGGAVGITEDSSALRRWMVAGPAVSQLVAQYEEASELRDVSKQKKNIKYNPEKLPGEGPEVDKHIGGNGQSISRRKWRSAEYGHQGYSLLK